MSSAAPTAFVPSSGPATVATPTKGGVVLSPMAVGGRRRKSRKLTKKMRKALKALHLMGGEVKDTEGVPSESTEDGGRRRRKTAGRRRRHH